MKNGPIVRSLSVWATVRQTYAVVFSFFRSTFIFDCFSSMECHSIGVSIEHFVACVCPHLCPYAVCGAKRFPNIVKKYDNIRAVVFVIEFVAYKCVTKAG